MPALKEIPRSARVAWCPYEHHKTLLALGGRGVGAQLEFINLDLSDFSRRGYETPVTVNIGDSFIGCLAWAAAPEASVCSLGYLAAGCSDGSVRFWSPSEFLNHQSETFKSHTNTLINECPGQSLIATIRHTCAVTSLQFNPVRQTLIACGHQDGLVNVINLENQSVPEVYEPGADPVRIHGGSSVTAVAWNTGVQHILASTCANGSTTIWNLRQKKPSIKFRDPANRLRSSSVAWLPNQSTQVVVAYDDDTNPSFQMWDLRNASYPFKEFPGHTRGIVDIQFSENDPMMMISSGKDNRVVCWAFDDQGGAPTIFSDLATSEWNDSVRWSPKLPGLFASTSHVEGVFVESVQERRNPVTKYVPRWQQSPAGVFFGFGGKLGSFHDSNCPVIHCGVIPSTDVDLIRQADEFERTLVDGDYAGYCEKRILEAEDEHEKLAWQVVQTLFFPVEHRASSLLEKLGFQVHDLVVSVEAYLGRKPGLLFHPEVTKLLDHSLDQSGDKRDISAMTASYGDNGQTLLNQVVDAGSFFDALGEKSMEEKDWTDGVASTAAGAVNGSDVVDVPGSLHGSKIAQDVPRLSMDAQDYSTEADRLVKEALLVGQRPIAIEMCIETDKWAEAFLLAATSGDQTLWEKTQALYLKRRSHDKFLQVLGCIINRNWDEVVKQADLSKWEETVALLASYVPSREFPSLVKGLGLRLEKERFDIRAAAVCYLAAGNFENAAQVWTSLSVSGNRGKSLQRSLQDLVEKLAVLKRATNYQLNDPLFNQKVSQYAELLANSGRLVAGMKFLCLVSSEPADPKSLTSVLRERMYHAAPAAMRQAGIPPPTELPFSHVDVVTSFPALQRQPLHAPLQQVQSKQSTPYLTNLYNHPSISNRSDLIAANDKSQPAAVLAPPLRPTSSFSTSMRPPVPIRPPIVGGFSDPYRTTDQLISSVVPPTRPRPPIQAYECVGARDSGVSMSTPLSRLSQPKSVTPSAPAFLNATSVSQQPDAFASQFSPPPPQSFGVNAAGPFQTQQPSNPPVQPLFYGSHGQSSGTSVGNGVLANGAPSLKSTAPAAGVVHLPPGMPVPWPIPTGTQQVGSTTQTAAPANQKIQGLASNKGEGVAMGSNDVIFVQKALLGALEAQIQHDPHNSKKHEDQRLKLQELISQLQAGLISKVSQDLILQFSRALDVGDIAAAGQVQAQLARNCWAKEARNWLMALKRLISK